MKIADGVAVLKLTMELMGRQSIIYPTLIWDKDTAILVDTGVPGQLKAIQEGMAIEDVPFDRLVKVIITHQDIDHIGGLPDLLRESGGRIEVLAHAEEKPYIEGQKPLIKLQMGKFLDNLPEEQRRRMVALFSNPPKAGVDRTVADGERLPYCGGITVIATPGHTPGHISLYLNRTKVLITGDALTVSEGTLLGPNPRATADPDQANKSLRKLLPLDIETVICYHGGVYQNKVNQRLAELANGA